MRGIYFSFERVEENNGPHKWVAHPPSGADRAVKSLCLPTSGRLCAPTTGNVRPICYVPKKEEDVRDLITVSSFHSCFSTWSSLSIWSGRFIVPD